MRTKKVIKKVDAVSHQSGRWNDMKRAKESSTMELHRHRNVLNEGLASYPDNKKARLEYLEHLKIVNDEIILRNLVKM